MRNFLQINKILNSLSTIFVSKSIIYFKSIYSTNDFAINLVDFQQNFEINKTINHKILDTKQSLNNGTVIIAEKQTKGKGRLGRTWFSPPGGLWFTIILNITQNIKKFKKDKVYNKSSENTNYINLSYKLASKLTILTASALLSALNNYLTLYDNLNNIKAKENNQNKFFIKWPNDIYFSGKKLAGILLESVKFKNNLYLFIGIGINVNNKITTSKKINQITTNEINQEINAISLAEIYNTKIDREVLFAEIINDFENKYIYYIQTNDFNFIFSQIKEFIKLY